MKTKIPRSRPPYNETKAYWLHEVHAIMLLQAGITTAAQRERLREANRKGLLCKRDSDWVEEDFPVQF